MLSRLIEDTLRPYAMRIVVHAYPENIIIDIYKSMCRVWCIAIGKYDAGLRIFLVEIWCVSRLHTHLVDAVVGGFITELCCSYTHCASSEELPLCPCR